MANLVEKAEIVKQLGFVMGELEGLHPGRLTPFEENGDAPIYLTRHSAEISTDRLGVYRPRKIGEVTSLVANWGGAQRLAGEDAAQIILERNPQLIGRGDETSLRITRQSPEGTLKRPDTYVVKGGGVYREGYQDNGERSLTQITEGDELDVLRVLQNIQGLTEEARARGHLFNEVVAA